MREVLDEIGVSAVDETRRQALDQFGYCRFDAFLDASQVEGALSCITELLATSGRQGGTLHLGGLLNAGPMFDPLWLRPELLAAVTHLLGVDFQVGEMHYRAGLPGHGSQALHIDSASRGGPGEWLVCNAIVALTDFTGKNGATRVVPGSHLDLGFQAPKGHGDHPGQSLLIGPGGTCWLFNGHLWHSGTRNRSDAPRHAVLVAFNRRVQGSPTWSESLPTDEVIERLGSAAYLLL